MMSSGSKKIMKKLVLRRNHEFQDWGFELTGGWEQGQWIEVMSVNQLSPAHKAGLLPGDFLVKCHDELALFKSHHDIEEMLRRIKTLEMEVEIERGQIAPMTLMESSKEPAKSTDDLCRNEDEIFTIILDKQRGIYHWTKKS